MKKTSPFLLVLALCLIPPSFAATQDCTGIKIDKKRLECFDSATRNTGNKTSKEPPAADKLQADIALKALRKLNGATEMGVSMRDYSQLVLEQVSNIDDALRGMRDGALKSTIAKSREAYVDARTLWSEMFSAEYVSVFVQYSKPTYSKYDIDEKYLVTLNGTQFAKTSDMNKSLILNPVWAAGKSALDKAEQLASGAKL